uniref:Epidermal patterning factor-like protein n=3 Tax=Hordeum vulgare TaxID=4513 RepID=M0YB70_HORVV
MPINGRARRGYICLRGARTPCTTPQPAPALEHVVLRRALQSRLLLSECHRALSVHQVKLLERTHAGILGMMMKRHGLAARVHHVRPLLVLLAAVLLLAATVDGIRPDPDDHARPGQAPGAPAVEEKKDGSGFLQEEVYGTGSSLPDCTHACGACKPCNRVMVSFKCSIAEPCPMVYRCMCKGKCYPVPSS